MDIQSIDILGNSSIGIFGLSTNNYSMIPYGIKPNIQTIIKDTLGIQPIETTINNSNLIGLFCTGNNKNLLIPKLTNSYEIETISNLLPEDSQLHIIDSKLTALGNIIVTNDSKTIVSTEFTSAEQKQISDALDTELISKDIMNTTIVGSLIYGNQNGILAHPLISDDDLDFIEDFFNTKVDVVTVNRGTPYPRPGLMGNDNGVLVGSDTTGPEIMRIFDVLVKN